MTYREQVKNAHLGFVKVILVFVLYKVEGKLVSTIIRQCSETYLLLKIS